MYKSFSLQKYKNPSLLFLGSLFFLLPAITNAQGSLLVPCSGSDCGTCEIIQLANNVTDIIIALAVGISVIIFMYAGWLMLSSGGSSAQIKRGKDVMTNVLIGLIIILTAWLVIDVMLKTLLPNGEVQFGNNNPMPWNQIVCSDQVQLKDGTAIFPDSSEWQMVVAVQPFDPTNPQQSVLPSPGGHCPLGYTLDAFGSCIQQVVLPSAGGQCPQWYTMDAFGSCVAPSGPVLPSPGGSCPPGYTFDPFGSCVFNSGFTSTVSPTGSLTSYGGRQFDSGVVSNVQYVDQNFGLRLTSGYRTSTQNSSVGGSPNSYHLSGRAADFVGTQAQMQAAQQWAQANGAREALIHNAGSGTHLHVAW